ncbi:MAG: pyridoxal phosphate biosynthetic protein PdxJ [Verrucomicrobiales bacterium]|nr:pyridoxal phosphate biosynthetic protein PdxJ [Verrucomicrobiales bacterium]
MLALGVNIDHVATLRQARYALMPEAHNAEPLLLEAVAACEEAGAHGITIHLREDRRHIQDADVYQIRQAVKIHLNLEIGNAPEIVEIACQVRPDSVCLVPENRQEITTEGGLDVAGHEAAVAATTARLQEHGIRVSLFIDPDPAQVEASARVKADMIELHTGAYANTQGAEREAELRRLIAAGRQARGLGLQVNAGHGITTANLPPLLDIPGLAELNIGHHIISRAMRLGLRDAVREMLTAMQAGPSGC